MNKKIPLRSKIDILIDNYGKPAFFIPFFTIGITSSIIFICSCGKLASFVGMILGAFWGLIIAPLAAPAIGRWFGDFIYAPREYLKTAPDIISPIKGLIAREEYEEAIGKLHELLEEKPFSPEPYAMLVELYANELNDHLRAMEMVENYFGQKKVYIFEENIELLLLYADLCQEHNYLEKAERLLAQETARKGYPEIKRKALATRLEAIRESCEL